ncbi:MAG: (2Fe-2S)-binding protein [Deltaproteobacteria bacterium]|nr:(2Fe-2S)-binding protein [Deltaproteobacteria bacterium]
MIELTINGVARKIDATPDMPLLWALRDVLGYTGTKFGCGMSLCGACTVHLNGTPIRACVTPVSSVQGMKVTTIEGIAANHPVKEAWKKLNVPQCGYCQSGQIMSAVALLAQKHHPTESEIDQAMAGNLCRCGTYPRIKSAILEAAQKGSK